jgi:hypothetical protein
VIPDTSVTHHKRAKKGHIRALFCAAIYWGFPHFWALIVTKLETVVLLQMMQVLFTPFCPNRKRLDYIGIVVAVCQM